LHSFLRNESKLSFGGNAMEIPNIPQYGYIKIDEIPKDPKYQYLRVVYYNKNLEDKRNYDQGRYDFMQNTSLYNTIKVMLCRKGAKDSYRIVADAHLNMQQFRQIVMYDPSDPVVDDYEAQGMRIAHEQTQSDFKGQKRANMIDYKNYILEGIKGERTIYLPTISGWQSKKWFDMTVFVAFDDSNDDALYGILYLPKKPIMQSDGQTQTAAIFQTIKTIDAISYGALETLNVTLEIELNVDQSQAAQSFADRNGRGSKKNKNLVIKMDTSSPLSRLRSESIVGTIFENRLADGRSTGTSETATRSIIDLSTIEQMILNVISNGRMKPEHFKLRYNKVFLYYCREFFEMLDELFGKEWLEQTPQNRDPFRKEYVHGWPFALKAISKAYFYARIEEIGPLSAAIGKELDNNDVNLTVEEKYLARIEYEKRNYKNSSNINFDNLKDRLSKIDWHRYRQHWIGITGYSIKDGKKKTFQLKSNGEYKVVAMAPNTAGVIESVCSKILSESWIDLCGSIDEPLD
jgi:hypothetical protein